MGSRHIGPVRRTEAKISHSELILPLIRLFVVVAVDEVVGRFCWCLPELGNPTRDGSSKLKHKRAQTMDRGTRQSEVSRSSYVCEGVEIQIREVLKETKEAGRRKPGQHPNLDKLEKEEAKRVADEPAWVLFIQSRQKRK